MHFDPEQFKAAIPFVGLMVHDQRSRPYITRLLEQAIPGAVVGITVAMLGIWKSDSIQDERIAAAAKQAALAMEKAQQIEQDRFRTRIELMERLHNIEKKIDKVIP